MADQNAPNSPMTPAKARLSEKEKRDNHIQSEKKRREAIREGFDRLARIVPGMEGQGRSEAIVLQATVQFMKQKLQERDKLRTVARERGMDGIQFDDYYRAAEKEARIREETAQTQKVERERQQAIVATAQGNDRSEQS